MSDKKQPNPSGPEPGNQFAGYPVRVISELARLIIPQAIQLLELSTDSPADQYRREVGDLIAPGLRLWVAMSKGSDPVELFGFHLAAGDAAYKLTALLTSAQFLDNVYITLTGQNATVPEMAWQIKTRHRPAAKLQQEITRLAKKEPEQAAYLQRLLDEYEG